MSHHDDHNGTWYFGGAVVAVLMLGFLVKILKALFIELTLMFSAIGKMAASFITMAWYVAQVAGLISIAVLVIYAAWYFSLKYHRMVKRGTELKEYVEARLLEAESKLEESLSEFKQQSYFELQQMRSELDLALKKSEVIPQPLSTEANQHFDQEDNCLAATNSDSLNNEMTIQEPTRPTDITNPF